MGLHRAAVRFGGAVRATGAAVPPVAVVGLVVLILVAVAFYGAIKQLMSNRLRTASGSRADRRRW